MIVSEYKTYFNSAYKGADDFDKKILTPILGKIFPAGSSTNYALEPDYKDAAKKANIKVITDVGEYSLRGDPIRFFDVTLEDNSNLSVARVNIRKVVTKLWKENFSGAIIIFHYDDTSAKETWRFSWVERRTSERNSTPGKRYTYLCGPSYSCRTIAERFVELENGKKDLPSITKAFDVEALSDEFFKEYKVMYDDIVQWITGQRIIKKAGKWRLDGKFGTGLGNSVLNMFIPKFGPDEGAVTKAVRDYVKKLMGRLVFIQFLQKKDGWLTINKKATSNFLLDLFNGVGDRSKDNFIEKPLEQVVYLLLNNKNRKSGDEKIDGLTLGVPFLNGGLFEPDAYDKLKIQLPKEFFHNPNCQDVKRELNKQTALRPDDQMLKQCGILDLFNHYNFTIDENDSNNAEVGVDPEMLGKIFENLLEDNKEKGAFYTPKEVVQYMCKESLIAYLCTKVPGYDVDIRAFVEDEDKTEVLETEKEKVLDALWNVKICDPAIGSGAFPMGLLNLLVALREKLQPNTQRAELKKEIIQNNIYGVDIEKGAIDIARLRFWLSIMVDEEKPTPLPNFEYKFMQGNSLLTTFDLQYVDIKQAKQNGTITKQINEKKKDLLEKKRDFYGLSGDNKYKKEVEIKLLIVDILKLRLGIEQASVEQQDTTRQMELFAAPEMPQNSRSKIKIQEVKAAQERVQRLIEKLLEIEKQLNDKSKSWEEKAKTDILFFDWEICFAEFFPQDKHEEERGFDIVIGNPPYFNIETLGAKSPYANAVKETYSNIWQDKSDILFYFFELAMNLSKNIICFITSNAYLFSDKARKLRNSMIQDGRLKKITNFEEFMIFNNADITTCISMFNLNNEEFKGVNVKGKDFSLQEVMEYIQDRQNEFLVRLKEDCVFALVDNKIDALNLKIDGGHELLENLFEIGEGMQTGANPVFCFSVYPAQFPTRFIKRRMGGINRYYLSGDEEYLLYIEDVEKFKDLPENIQVYLNNHQNELFNRAQIKRSRTSLWWKFTFAMHKELYPLPKIWCSYRSKTNEFVLDESQDYIGLTNTTVVFDTNQELSIKYLLALLNSKLLTFRYKSIGKQTGSGVYEYYKNGVGKLPIPKVILEQKQIISLVDQILTAKKANPQADTTALERKIDILVYLLYGLTWEEVQIVESSSDNPIYIDKTTYESWRMNYNKGKGILPSEKDLESAIRASFAYTNCTSSPCLDLTTEEIMTLAQIDHFTDYGFQGINCIDDKHKQIEVILKNKKIKQVESKITIDEARKRIEKIKKLIEKLDEDKKKREIKHEKDIEKTKKDFAKKLDALKNKKHSLEEDSVEGNNEETIDQNSLQEKICKLNREYERDLARIKAKRAALEKEKKELEDEIAKHKGEPEETEIIVIRNVSILGEYYRADSQIILYLETIRKSAFPSYKLFQTYIHEMFHAYYDANPAGPDYYIEKVEEPITELGALTFIEKFTGKNKDKEFMDFAVAQVEKKQFNPAVCHYGFGAYLFKKDKGLVQQYYDNRSKIVNPSSDLTAYEDMFKIAYPTSESDCLDKLKKVLGII